VRILLDTCTFLWIADGSPRLSRTARELVLEEQNSLFLSVASAWEIAVKFALGRLSLFDPPHSYVPSRRARNGVFSLPLTEEETLLAGTLARHHNDPFDRILIGQSIVHDLVILSPDPVLAKYPVRLIW
jgi:PIN domain nuclease of toxin-antitoxin system